MKLAFSVPEAAAWRRAEDGFAACNVSPSSRTRAAAAMLELWLSDEGVPRGEIQSWLDDIYTGRCSARVLKDDDVALGGYKEKPK